MVFNVGQGSCAVAKYYIDLTIKRQKSEDGKNGKISRILSITVKIWLPKIFGCSMRAL